MVNIYGISKFHVKLFTDAVFGVAITLLAVELQAPNIENSGIFDISQFEELFTIFVSYITTFVIIGNIMGLGFQMSLFLVISFLIFEVSNISRRDHSFRTHHTLSLECAVLYF